MEAAERLKKPGKPGVESDASHGSAFTMAEEEVDDQKLKVKEDFDDLHVKIMAVSEQIKGLEAEFYQRVSAKSVELEGLTKEDE